MELIILAAVGLLGIVGAALSKILADDAKAWRPRITEFLVARAVTKLPAAERERYDEEWRGHLDDVPGDIGKVAVAIGFNFAARSIAAVPDRQRNSQCSIPVLKRIEDVVLSSALILVMLPCLVAIAFLIRIDSRGPVLVRVPTGASSRGQSFRFKFRTTHIQTELVQKPEQHLTRCGRLLHRYSLDELPALLNVLRGEMSIVGPRVAYDDLNVKSGITGWSQVNGATDDSPREEEHDRFYATKWSVLVDLKILWKTALVVVRDSSQG